MADHDKANTDHLGALNLDALNKLFQNAKETLPKQVEDTNDQIKTLETERDDLMKEKAGNVSDIVAQQMDLPPATTGDDATAPTPKPAAHCGSDGGSGGARLLHVYFRGGKLVVQARRIYAEEPSRPPRLFPQASGHFRSVAPPPTPSHLPMHNNRWPTRT